MSTIASIITLAQEAERTGSFAWNPTVRGVLFPAIMFVMLCGSSYMIMATNMGNRLGFLVASGAFMGWMMMMALVWMLYNIGLQGTAPTWKPDEVLVGENLKFAQDDSAAKIPLGEHHDETSAPKVVGWRFVPEGAQARGDSQSAVDARLAAASGEKFFEAASDYVILSTYERGWRDPTPGAATAWFGSIRRIVQDIGLFQDNHRLVTQVQAVQHQALIENGECVRKAVKRADGRLTLAQFEENFVTPAAGVVPTAQNCRIENVLVDGQPVPQQIHSVVLHRDGGSRRRPGFQVFLSSAVLFGIICGALHKRDKAVMARMKDGALLPVRA